MSRLVMDSIIANEVAIANKHRYGALPDPTFMPVHLTGGIGDVIMAIELIEELAKTYRIVVYTKHVEALKYFYRGSIGIHDTPPDFTWLLRIDHLARFHFLKGFSGFQLPEHKELFLRQKQLLISDDRLSSIYHTPLKYFLAARHAESLGLDRRTLPMHCLGLPLVPITVQDRTPPTKTITIHDGFDAQNSSLVSGRATKQWDWKSWNTTVQTIKKAFPDYEIIQVGASTSRPIDGVDTQLLGKTTLTQAFDIIKTSSLHIDGDSGMVHAATKMGVPCVVLWGPTPKSFFSYSQNVNLSSQACTPCYGLKRNWMSRCPLKYSAPICMDAIKPETVIEEIRIILRK